MSKKDPPEPIPLTGRVWTINALADLYPSRDLEKQRDVKRGDLKLWCQRARAKSAPVASGQFRVAVYDGKLWRTFRLNIVTRDNSFYESFSDRDRKAGLVITGLASLKDQLACYRLGTWGVTFTLRRESTPAPAPAATQAAPTA